LDARIDEVNRTVATKEEEQTDCGKGFAAKNFPWLHISEYKQDCA